MKLRTRVLNVGPRQSAISSLTNLWATESMRMILTSIDCERTGIEDYCKADSIQRCAVESMRLCYVWVLGFD